MCGFGARDGPACEQRRGEDRPGGYPTSTRCVRLAVQSEPGLPVCTLEEVRTEMSLHVLAYNVKRVIAILGAGPLMRAIRA